MHVLIALLFIWFKSLFSHYGCISYLTLFLFGFSSLFTNVLLVCSVYAGCISRMDRYLFLFQFFFIYNLFLWFSGISETIRIHASSMSTLRLHSRFDKSLYQNSYADHDYVNLLPWDLPVYST